MKKLKNTTTILLAFFAPLVASAQWNPTAGSASGLPGGSIYDIVHNLMYWLLGIFGIFAVIGFVISGIMYIISTGSEDTMKHAKSAMIYSIVGVVVALSGLVIIYAIDGALRGYSNF